MHTVLQLRYLKRNEVKRMKIKVVGIACLFVLIGAWVYVHAQTVTHYILPSGPVGRYQVVALDFDETTMSGVMKHKTAVRIDTQTGQAWELGRVNTIHDIIAINGDHSGAVRED